MEAEGASCVVKPEGWRGGYILAHEWLEESISTSATRLVDLNVD